MYTPKNYEKINIYASHNFPSTIKARNNRSFAFWERALFQRAQSVIEFDMPDEWDGNVKDFIIYCLFRFGYGVVSKNEQYGIFFQPCTLSGYDFYYQPTKAIVSNPLLDDGKSEFEIGEDCEIVKLTPDYMGIWDIIDYYAEKLSNLDNAINMGLINNKFPYIFGARNKSGASAIKKIMDHVNKGEPTIVYDARITDDSNTEQEPWQFLDLKVKEHYLTDVQLKDMQTLLNNFNTEIGIPTVPYEKKERMVTSEAESKQIESLARATIWIDTLNNSFIKVNEMFGTSLNAKLRFENMYLIDDGGEKDEFSETND